MTKVVLDVSTSLDGFTIASGVRPEEPAGDGGQRSHGRARSSGAGGREILAEMRNAVGAMIAGRLACDPCGPQPVQALLEHDLIDELRVVVVSPSSARLATRSICEAPTPRPSAMASPSSSTSP
jgi:hypothetical protein